MVSSAALCAPRAQLEHVGAAPRLIYLQVGEKEYQWVSSSSNLLPYPLCVQGGVSCGLAIENRVPVVGISYPRAENTQEAVHLWKKTWLWKILGKMKQVIQAASCDPFVVQPDSRSIFNRLYWSEIPAIEAGRCFSESSVVAVVITA